MKKSPLHACPRICYSTPDQFVAMAKKAQDSTTDALRMRVQKCRETIETFARVQEELVALQGRLTARRVRDGIQHILNVNRASLAQYRESLAAAEEELRRLGGP